MNKLAAEIDNILSLISIDSKLMVEAEKTSNLDIVSERLLKVAMELNELKEEVEKQSSLTSENLDEMAALATEFEASGDPMLVRQANLLDEILMSIGASNSFKETKEANEHYLNQIKDRLNNVRDQELYKFVKDEQDKNNRIEESKKLLAENVKPYKPLEHSLSTRYCPDHYGVNTVRVADDVYQCSLDKAIYNFTAGFKLLNGREVPGSCVSNQTSQISDIPHEHTSFDTRESRLNQEK